LEIDWIYILAFLVIVLSALINGVTGFGFSLFAMGFLPLFIEPASATIICTALALIANIRVFFSVRKNFVIKDFLVPSAGLIIALPIGVYFFRQLDSNQLRLFIGIALLIAVAVMISVNHNRLLNDWLKKGNFRFGNWLGLTAGSLGGFLGGTASIPGPPIILYGTFNVSFNNWTTQRMKAFFNAFFASVMMLRLVNLSITGDITRYDILLSLFCIPAVFIGAWAGIRIFTKTPHSLFNHIVLVLLSANALILIVTAVL
jgi:uncharacterized membrane protein YfcA